LALARSGRRATEKLYFTASIRYPVFAIAPAQRWGFCVAASLGRSEAPN